MEYNHELIDCNVGCLHASYNISIIRIIEISVFNYQFPDVSILIII